ncbi:aminopeptidase O isoform X3 [Gallus gallus]|uniref:aminopeptidase O isoform X3 n=1 Tax=Gallus gallus TaxID=9031 RepID=UPI001AE8F542|nr:aminopeptidase O isoform X3 [Gallus gallus]XP_046791772.1 aminopeptidase O isoform X3 [Gallus gallus]
MEMQLDPTKDDLPLMANTNHMIVKHYVLDLDVDFKSQVIEGNIVLFLETGNRYRKAGCTGKEGCQSHLNETCKTGASEPCHVSVSNASVFSSEVEYSDFAICGKGEKDTSDKNGNHSNEEQASGIASSKNCDTESHGNKDFLLVLDCCDLSVLKVEEVDIAAVSGIEKFIMSAELTDVSKELENLRNQIVHKLVTLPSDRCQEQLYYYTCCSQAPGCGELEFTTGSWSLEIRKRGVQTPTDFPHAIRIWYKTKPEGRSVTWTTDQSGRPCVYTMGSPINNRALFPCQEPPIALSTWQASVRASAAFVVLMSGENSAEPVQLQEGVMSWYYYVTMPMPASTFTIAVGCWQEVKQQCFTAATETEDEFSVPFSQADFRWHKESCGHVEYPCRFQNPAATLQRIIPYRVFAPLCLMECCEEHLLQLIPQCLSAAYSTLGTHPFSRLDVLIVPSNFSSLGMASPHIIFLSQSVLPGGSHLRGTRLCHEIAHSWFGLAIGARDWTEEWISEGFATFLEDIFWTRAQQQLSYDEGKEQQELKALLRWRRLRDEVQNSEEELQVLRPHKESTGEVSESGASVVKHGLKEEKVFMQVHYLKGFFLLRFLASTLGEASYLASLRKFVHKFHGQLVLSQPLLEEGETWKECKLVQQVRTEVTKWIQANQRIRKSSKKKRKQEEVVFQKLLPDQLVLLLEYLLEEKTLCPRTLQHLEKTYQLHDQDAEVRHRWCELVVKHKYVPGYGDIEKFLREDQAMGVYLYGELMLNEDAKQQELAFKCFAAAQEQMDMSAAKVVAEMLF